MLKEILPLLVGPLTADVVFFLSCLVGPPAGTLERLIFIFLFLL
jgi:hypothetical protein